MGFRKENVVLRKMEMSDASGIATQANNKKIADNLRDIFPSPYTIEDAEWFVNFAINESKDIRFIIQYKDQLAGLIGLHVKEDVYAHNYEIGYWLGESYWGLGIGTKAVGLITDYGFTLKNCHRIYAGIFDYNIGSMKILEKNGYRKEAILKQAIYKNGKYWDEHKYAKLKSEHH